MGGATASSSQESPGPPLLRPGQTHARTADTSNVAVIVVNFRTKRFLPGLIESLQQRNLRQITVVDNFSSEAEGQEVEELCAATGAQFVSSTRNLGFAGGVNAGVEAAGQLDKDTVLWVLNPDTVVKSLDLTPLFSLARQKDVGMATPLLLTGTDEAPTIWFRSGVVDWRAGEVHHPLFGRPLGADVEGDATVESDYLTGAALALRKEVWDLLGGLDQDFFLYWEDVQFSLRVRAQGLKLATALNVFVWHAESGSAQATGRGRAFYYYMARNRAYVLPPATRSPAVRIRRARYHVWLLLLAVRENERRWTKAVCVLLGICDQLAGRRGQVAGSIRRTIVQGRDPR